MQEESLRTRRRIRRWHVYTRRSSFARRYADRRAEQYVVISDRWNRISVGPHVDSAARYATALPVNRSAEHNGKAMSGH